MKLSFFLLLTLSLALLGTKAGAQTIVLDDFTFGNQPNEGAALAGTTWVGQVTQFATTITIAGSAHDDNGWGVFNRTPLDASTIHWITITGQLDAGNTAPFFNVQFFDDNFGGQAFSISTSAFLTTMTTVSIPVIWSGIDPSILTAWTIGGGDSSVNAGSPNFRMTLDQLSLSATAIPEPGTYAVIAGVFALGCAFWRRRAVRA